MANSNTTTKQEKPWDKLGISYQQYYYRKKMGTLGDDEAAAQRATITGNDAIRNDTLVNEFLNRCEARSAANVDTMMDITPSMAGAIYSTLRQDGH